MDIAVLTIFPRMLDAIAEHGIVAQALAKGALTLRRWNPRDFTDDPHRAVDDRPFGGGPGMVMKPVPLAAAIDAARVENRGPVVYLSPQGECLDQALLAELAAQPALILLAGRYAGIDERIIDSRVEREISLGDYVLAGGELAAMVLIEGIARLLPGVLGNELSAQQDSFAASLDGESSDADGFDGLLLDCPQYTRPEVFEGRAVPAVLRSGDHEAIRRWRRAQAYARTRARRPDLLAKCARESSHKLKEFLNADQSEQNDDECN